MPNPNIFGSSSSTKKSTKPEAMKTTNKKKGGFNLPDKKCSIEKKSVVNRNEVRLNEYGFNVHDTIDDYQTPESAIEPLMKYIPKDITILEPSQGEGNITNYLKKSGYNVIGKDIKTGFDFLKPDSTKNMDFDMIITNPPYSKKNEFLKKAYETGKPFCYLMPLLALETKERLDLYKKNGVELLVLNERVKFKPPPNKKTIPRFPSDWFCHNVLPDKLVFQTDNENKKESKK
jgi:hypothetical protein